MAVGIRLKFSGGTQANYDAAHAIMEVDTDPPAGMIVHSAGPIEGGWGVIDFWESREAFDSFRGSAAYAAPPESWRPRVSKPARREGVRGPQPPDAVARGRDGVVGSPPALHLPQPLSPWCLVGLFSGPPGVRVDLGAS